MLEYFVKMSHYLFILHSQFILHIHLSHGRYVTYAVEKASLNKVRIRLL